MKRIFFILIAMIAVADSSNAYADTALSAQAFDECKARIMSVSGEEFAAIDQTNVVEACQNFPLSDDVFVQVLGGVIGPDMLTLLDIYTGITGREHGFDETSQLFVIAAPLHEVLYSFNLVFASILLIGLSLGFFTQMLRWQKGEVKEGAKDWFGKKGPSNGISIFFSIPVIGWMTPIQAAAVTAIILVGFVAKMAVSYLFLASFFSNVGTSVKGEISEELQINYGRTIMLFQCDLERREILLSGIQESLNSRAKGALSSGSLYNCLTSGAASSNSPLISEVGLSYEKTYRLIPATLNQTQMCINGHKKELKEWGMEEPESCGYIQFNLPDNTSYPNSINNAVSLYANPTIALTQRGLALKAHEYECRTGRLPTYDGEVADKCLSAVINGGGYSYRFIADSISGEDKLAYFREPLKQVEKASFSSSVKKELRALNSKVSSNTSGMLNHIVDLLAPKAGDEELSSAAKDRRDSLAERLKQQVSETGSLGVSETDINYLVNNIKRGAWTSSSLFFGSLTESLENSGIVTSLKAVYSVPSNFLDEISNSKLLILKEMQSGGFDDTFSSDTKLSSLIIPRLGLYLDNVNCWHEQYDCKMTPLNPFIELGSRGAALTERAMTGYIGTKLLQTGLRSIMGFSPKNKYARFMVLDTLGEFQWLYLIIGLVLAILVPLIPFLKMLVMMINWVSDIVRELMSLQVKICWSSFSDHGSQFISEDVRESLSRLVGLGLYFLFIIIGIIVALMMFSFLYSLNVFLVGMLSSSITWGVSVNSIEEALINLIFDVIIAFLILYQVTKCSAYIEKIPKDMAEHFKVKVSSSESALGQMTMYLRNNVAPGVSSMMHKLGNK